MWYFKETAKSIWKASKGMVVDNRSQVQRLIDQIGRSQQEIISTAKLNDLAAFTYEIQKFEQTLETIIKIIKTFQYDLQQAHKTLNIFIATNYLIKHGATAFVDQLRNQIHIFKKYQTLKDLKTYEDQVLQKQLSYELEKIKSRARHIELLLSDKQKLLKQKELSMLIKQKMKLYEKSQTADSKQNFNNDNRKDRLQKEKERLTIKNANSLEMNQSNKNKKFDDYTDKMDGYLEKYLWKYVDKLDGKIQKISEKVMENFDKYVLGELPQNFEPDQIQQYEQQVEDQSDKKMKRQKAPENQYQSLDDDDLMKRLDEEGEAIPQNSNLIDFQEVNQDDDDNKNAAEHQQSLI